MAATVISFGEWLPDLPALGNPGLTVANNVIADDGNYRPYQPLVPFNAGVATLPAPSIGLFLAYDETLGDTFYAAGVIGANSRLYMSPSGGAFTAKSATLSGITIGEWQFAQYEKLTFAVDGNYSLYHTVRAATDFATLSAPIAGVVAVVNDFVVLGDLTDAGATRKPHVIQWSGIADPLNFPTPNSATAIAVQSGEQFLQKNFGNVTGIVPGDQYAIIFQDSGITRMTYAGPPVVFQFNEIEKSRGGRKGSIIKVGGLTYFYSNDGFFVTDGVNVTPIGEGKVNQFFKNGCNDNSPIKAQFNRLKKTVTWGFLTSDQLTTTTSNKQFSFHIPTGKWTQADELHRSVDQSDTGVNLGPWAFDELNVLSRWNATAAPIGTATIATGELELNPGGRAYVDGVKPNIESSATAPAITVRVGARNDLGTVPSYTATTTPTTRTGFADFRVDSKYHRAEVQIVGKFDKAVGIEFKAFPTGES